MYAIVDIETTGSHPESNGITEIAIVLHNGKEIEGKYEKLINPVYPIPPYVSFLTGISNRMVSVAPLFEELAQDIYRLLKDRIFIAHNVNFDYSFIQYHFKTCGYDWKPRKLCTLKLSRKVFPGHHKYGLGHICRTLDIPVENRHRAGGDAMATTILFEKILEKGGEKVIKDFLKKESHDQILPPNLSQEAVNGLPYTPGVYYFHDAKGKIIYIGKAKNIKKRVLSHFTGLNTGKKRQDFLRCIHSVTFKECPTELTAFILESIEIKRWWPEYNFSQKHPEKGYGIYMFEDTGGYKRLAIDKKRKNIEAIAIFTNLSDAYRMLWKIVNQHTLDAALCFLDKTSAPSKNEPVDIYNARVDEAIASLRKNLGTFAIVEPSVYSRQQSFVLIENGRFYGMGTVPGNKQIEDITKLKNFLTQYPENDTIYSLVKSFIQKNTGSIMDFE